MSGNTQEAIEFFDAPRLVFVLLNVGPAQTSNAALPPCTLLRKIRNQKKSYLVASFPDYAQGYFSQSAVFPQLQDEFPTAMDLPLNSGGPLSIVTGQTVQNSSFSGAPTGVVCQSFQLITKVSKKNNLNQFKVVSKYTGIPTVGYNINGTAGQNPWPITVATGTSTQLLPFV